MISAIGKLRKWLDYKINRFDPYRNAIILNTGVHLDELYDIADEIEATYMQLPLDADGVSIRPGDLIESEYMKNGPMIVANIGKLDVYAYNEYETGFFIAAVCHHVKPDTVESLLNKFQDDVLSAQGEYAGKVIEADCYLRELRMLIEDYAERIRETMKYDAHNH